MPWVAKIMRTGSRLSALQTQREVRAQDRRCQHAAGSPAEPSRENHTSASWLEEIRRNVQVVEGGVVNLCS